MKRRTFLGTTGTAVGLIGLAGCLGPGGEETPTDQPEETGTPTESPTETETETPTETATETPTETATETATQTDGAGGTDTATGTGTGTDQQQIATHYRFGGSVEAWMGREPQRIADAQNPTLELEAGRTYEVTWENLDGVPHDFTILDSEENVLAQTEMASEEGASLTLTFTASQEMAQYICTIHPSTMVGGIEITGGG